MASSTIGVGGKTAVKPCAREQTTFAARELKKLGGMAAVVKMFRLPGLDMKELAGLVLANITGEGDAHCRAFLDVETAAVCALVESAGDDRGKVRDLGSKILANVSAVEDPEQLKHFSRAFSVNGGFKAFFDHLPKGKKELQGNVAYAMGNFASEDDQVCSEILRVNGFQHLVKLFKSPDPEVCDSAVTAIANCLEGATSSEAACELTALGVAPLLCQILQEKLSEQRSAPKGQEQEGCAVAAAAAAAHGSKGRTEGDAVHQLGNGLVHIKLVLS